MTEYLTKNDRRIKNNVYLSFCPSPGVAVGCRSGGQLAMTFMDRYYYHSFPFSSIQLFSITTISHRMAPRIKRLFIKCSREPKA